VGLTDNLSCLVPEPEKNCYDNNASLDGAVVEMKNIYQERLPYVINEQINGFCLIWQDTFIGLCRYAMSTDCMNSMTAPEKEIWRQLVAFEDNHSYSVDATQCDGEAVGSTEPRCERASDGKVPNMPAFPTTPVPVAEEFKKPSLTYVWDSENQYFKLGLVPGLTMYPVFCEDEDSLAPIFDVPKAYVYDDLDMQFVKIERCLPYNDCGCEGTIPLQVNDCESLNNCSTYGDCEEDIFDTNCGDNYCSQNMKVKLKG